MDPDCCALCLESVSSQTHKKKKKRLSQCSSDVDILASVIGRSFVDQLNTETAGACLCYICRTKLASFHKLEQQIQGLREEIKAMARQALSQGEFRSKQLQHR